MFCVKLTLDIISKFAHKPPIHNKICTIIDSYIRGDIDTKTYNKMQAQNPKPRVRMQELKLNPTKADIE